MKQRKRNWHAGLTRAEHTLASEIQARHIEAFERERANGTLGMPGSMWEIGDDGLAKCREPSARDIVLGLRLATKSGHNTVATKPKHRIDD